MYPEPPDNKNKKIIASFIVILAVVLVTGSVIVFANKKDELPPSTSSATNISSDTTASVEGDSTIPNTNTSDSSAATTYKDGTYTAKASYRTPEGTESISVTVAVKDDAVSDVSISQSTNDREAAEYQAKFKSGYKTLVVGKQLAGLNLSNVSGSSLTPEGFNDALQEIRNQAQS